MKIIIQNNLNDNLRNLMRQCGYFENYDRQSQHYSYIRNLGRGHYPRFHLYAQESAQELVLNLHLDQKQVSYEGSSAHSGEYDSQEVLREGERIRQLLSAAISDGSASSSDQEEKGFFSKMFGG